MDINFEVRPTSNDSADVSDVRLDEAESPDESRTRKVARSQLVDNAHSDIERVKLTLCHQKRHDSKLEWRDVDHFDARTLRKGEEVRFVLNAKETHRLFQVLSALYLTAKDGIPRRTAKLSIVDEAESVFVKGRIANLIGKMLDVASDEFWDALDAVDPYLFQAISLKKLHEVRENAVELFGVRLKDGAWQENDWQKFFRTNTWIFGYGLDYRFLDHIANQPVYGGADVTNSGGQRGDTLMATSAENRFTVLVEIKTPETPLLEPRMYRNRTFVPGRELIGGVAQLQSNCRTWEMEGSTSRANQELLNEKSCYTVQPKGILVAGCTALLDSTAKRESFQMYRSSIHNLEIVTFDELHNRARHLLLQEDEEFEAQEQSRRSKHC